MKILSAEVQSAELYKLFRASVCIRESACVSAEKYWVHHASDYAPQQLLRAQQFAARAIQLIRKSPLLSDSYAGEIKHKNNLHCGRNAFRSLIPPLYQTRNKPCASWPTFPAAAAIKITVC